MTAMEAQAVIEQEGRRAKAPIVYGKVERWIGWGLAGLGAGVIIAMSLGRPIQAQIRQSKSIQFAPGACVQTVMGGQGGKSLDVVACVLGEHKDPPKPQAAPAPAEVNATPPVPEPKPAPKATR